MHRYFDGLEYATTLLRNFGSNTLHIFIGSIQPVRYILHDYVAGTYTGVTEYETDIDDRDYYYNDYDALRKYAEEGAFVTFDENGRLIWNRNYWFYYDEYGVLTKQGRVEGSVGYYEGGRYRLQ